MNEQQSQILDEMETEVTKVVEKYMPRGLETLSIGFVIRWDDQEITLDFVSRMSPEQTEEMVMHLMSHGRRNEPSHLRPVNGD